MGPLPAPASQVSTLLHAPAAGAGTLPHGRLAVAAPHPCSSPDRRSPTPVLPTVFGGGYIIWSRRKRAAQSVAHGAAVADPEKGCQVSTSGGSMSSWSSSSGDKRPDSRASGPPSSTGGSSGAKRSSSSGAAGKRPERGAAALLARLDSSNSLPRRQDSQGSMQSSPGGSRLYRQTSNVSAAGSANSPSKVYRQPGGPQAAATSPAGSGKLHRQKSSSGRFYVQESANGGGRLSHQGSIGGEGTPTRSPSKLSRQDSAGGGSRSPGRLYSQPSGGRAAAAAAAASAGAMAGMPWAVGPSSEEGWTDNPLAEAEPAAGSAKQGSFMARTRSPSEKSLSSFRLPAVSE